MSPLFGSNNGKKRRRIEFNAEKRIPEEIDQSPGLYSYIHNFKVHFKSSSLQMIANKVDVSVNSAFCKVPNTQEVTEQFNTLMLTHIGSPGAKTRSGKPPSYHITDVEYKESIALLMQGGQAVAVPVAISNQSVFPESSLCERCGARLVSGSIFCNKCGGQVLQNL